MRWAGCKRTGPLELKIWDSWLYSPGGYIASNSIVHGWTMRCLQRILERDKLPHGLHTPAPRPE